MKIEHDIAIFDNYFNDEYCDAVIDWFKLKSNHARHEKTPDRDDFTLSEPHVYFGSFKKELYGTLENKLSRAYFSYRNNYDVDGVGRYPASLPSVNRITFPHFKIQKSVPDGGFYAWHCEFQYDKPSACNRFLVWMVYLNDVTKGGKTEFKNGLKVQPKKGTLVLWPAYFTHLHRAAPDLKETKYIMTGWYEYEPVEIKED